jgi:hypothetical protein
LFNQKIGKKLICFGVDGDNVFQGHHSGCIILMRDNYALFSLEVLCMAHRMNLVIETLYPFISNIEGLLASLCTYFSGRPKRCIELVKLASIIETEGLEMLKCVKTRWVSMLSPCKRVLSGGLYSRCQALYILTVSAFCRSKHKISSRHFQELHPAAGGCSSSDLHQVDNCHGP